LFVIFSRNVFRVYPSASSVYSDPGARFTVASNGTRRASRTPPATMIPTRIAAYTIVRGRERQAAPVKAILLLSIGTRPCATVIRMFEDCPEIAACWSVAGPVVDAILVVEADSNEALGDVRARLAAVPGVTDITTAPVLKTVVERLSR